jgi:type IV secretion system protein TrbJ
MKKQFLPLLLGLAASASVTAIALLPASPAFAIPVFDATNYSQNLLQAARALQQINQQITQLQNEATIIQQGNKNLERIDFAELNELTQTMQQIDRLMGQAQGIDFKAAQMEVQFKRLYPGSAERILKSDARLAEAKKRLDTAMSAFQQAMGVQAQVVENVASDARTLQAIVAKSQGAAGGLQAQQATNQLLALTAKQQFQLQNLMAAQYRSESMEAARRAQSESEAQAATKKFLGNGKAYTPQN